MGMSDELDNLRESDSRFRKAIRAAAKRLENLAKTQWDCRAQLRDIEMQLLDVLVPREHVQFKCHMDGNPLAGEGTDNLLVDLKSMLECNYPDRYTGLIAAFRKELDSRSIAHP